MNYSAYQVVETENGFEGSITQLQKPELENGKVLIKVHYSSLNYKDALAATGVKGVVKEYPFTPGIDSAGEVIESKSDLFSEGDKVVVTGYKMGMSVNGGFGEIINVPENWIVKIPSNLSLLEVMEIGTAGLTAAASVKKLIDANVKNNLPILVSGATGGVGSVAVNILNKLNFEVHALTGKASENDVLTEMGAKKIIDRNNFMEAGVRPLDKAIYAGGIDTVGGDVLSKMLSMINNGGAVSCCGNVAGAKFTSSVFPFILRGVSLFGIDSAESDIELKKELWGLLSSDWFVSLSNQSSIVKLKDIEPEISKILEGKQMGRVVIKHGE